MSGGEGHLDLEIFGSLFLDFSVKWMCGGEWTMRREPVDHMWVFILNIIIYMRERVLLKTVRICYVSGCGEREAVTVEPCLSQLMRMCFCYEDIPVVVK
jgi:hypothetical protein